MCDDGEARRHHLNDPNAEVLIPHGVQSDRGASQEFMHCTRANGDPDGQRAREHKGTPSCPVSMVAHYRVLR